MYFKLLIVAMVVISWIFDLLLKQHLEEQFAGLADQTAISLQLQRNDLQRLETKYRTGDVSKATDETVVVMTRLFETEKEPSQEALCRLVEPYQRLFGQRFSSCSTCQTGETK